MDSIFSLDLPSEYRINELIFINSGSNYYVRLPVDTHAALISGNNSGKTSSLSALKLFLLPEVSFKKQKDKFNFHSGGSDYSDIDSYTYYFPSAESYVICNASNPKGVFSWVLYRTTNLAYERIAVPSGFDDFEHLFWDTQSIKNENIGALKPGIAISLIKKQLVGDYGGTLFSDVKSIGQALYTRASNAHNHSRYSLLPMAKGYSTASTQTLRSLLNIAFSLGNASTTSLPQAIASILDGEGMSAVKKTDSEGIFVDLDSQIEEWNQLKSTDAKLKLLKSKTPEWEYLYKSKQDYQRLKVELNDKFRALSWSLRLRQDECTKRLEEANKIATDAERAFQRYLPTYKEAAKTKIDTVSEKEATQKQLESLGGRIKDVDSVRSHLRPLCLNETPSDEELLEVLNLQITSIDQEITSLEDQDKAILTMDGINRRLQENKTARQRLKTSLSETDKESFLATLGDQHASVLGSLNSEFWLVNLRPSHDQLDVIRGFAGLFEVSDDEKLVFCGTKMNDTDFIQRDSKAISARLETKIVDLGDQIDKDENRLLKHKDNLMLTKEAREQKLQECLDVQKDLTKKRNSLKGIDALVSLYDETKVDLNIKDARLDEAITQFEAIDSNCRLLEIAFKDAQIQKDECSAPLDLIDKIVAEIRSIEADSIRLLDYDQSLLGFDPERAVSISLEALQSNLSELRQLLGNTKSRREECYTSIQRLMRYGIVEVLPEDLHAITCSTDKFNSYYSDLESEFLNLSVRQQRYREQLAHHNDTVAVAARTIENVDSIVKNFINGINTELATYKISNLTAVQLVVKLHPQYSEITKILMRVGSRNDQLLADNFYEQIANFQQSFYIRNLGKIDIAKIIEKLEYRFERNGVQEFKPQSNGTSCMVNAALLAMLLNRMVPEDLSLNIPVIFDEVGSIDENNFKEILKVVGEHGLSLFVANPEQSGLIASVLDVYHNLDVFKAIDVDVHGIAETIYFPAMEERLESVAIGENSEPVNV